VEKWKSERDVLFFRWIMRARSYLNCDSDMDAYTFPFEKLSVWKKSRELVTRIYQITKDFPRREIHGISYQIRKSAVSVASNIAEGTSRVSNKDRAHFSVMAYSILMELLNQLIISKDLGYLSENDYQCVRPLAEEISRMLISLRKAQLKR
jgi:four helix bundle protein